MAIAVISTSNGLPVRSATAPFGLPVTVSTNGFGLAVTPATVGGLSVFDVSGTLFGAAVIPSNLTPPVISGTPQAGQSLTTSNGTWGGTAATYTYQWKRAGANIGGATGTSYLLVAADIGSTITITVTATNTAGSANATSSATTAVTALPPANTTPPSISGGLTVGNVLTTTDGIWSGIPAPTISYQWKRGATSVGTNSNNYTLVTADIGATMTVVVTATNSGGSANSTAGGVGPVVAAPVAPVNTALPVISGTLMVAQALTTTDGTWTGTPTPTFSYQWKRGVTNVGTNSNSYTLVSADVGATMTVVVTGTNTAGNASATSSGVGPVINNVPVNTVLPVISGTPTDGQILSTTTGTWTGAATINFTYQWRRGGSNLGGATASTYTLVTADVGTMIDVVVTGTNGAGNSSATAAAVGPIASSSSEATVLFDATGFMSSPSANGITATNFTSQTPINVGSGVNGTSNMCLIVSLLFGSANGGTSSAPSVFWDSTGLNQAMTLIPGASISNGANGGDTFLFYRMNPALGAKRLTASWTGANQVTLGAVSFVGVNQTGGTTSFPTVVTNPGSSGTSATVTISTSPTTRKIVAAYNSINNFTTSSGTDIGHDNSMSTMAVAMNWDAGTATAMSYAKGSGGFAAVAAVIKGA